MRADSPDVANLCEHHIITYNAQDPFNIIATFPGMLISQACYLKTGKSMCFISVLFSQKCSL